MAVKTAKKKSKTKQVANSKTAGASPSAKLLTDPAFALSGLQKAVEQIGALTQQLHEKATPVAMMCTHFVAVRQASDMLDEINKALSETVQKLKTEIMPAAFEREDVTSFTLKAGFRVTLSTNVRASINGEGKLRVWHVFENGHIVNSHLDKASATSEAEASMSGKTVEPAEYTGKEAGYWWLRCNDMGDLIVETVNAQTLSSAVRARLDEGKDMPEELFNVALMPNTSITKVKQ